MESPSQPANDLIRETLEGIVSDSKDPISVRNAQRTLDLIDDPDAKPKPTPEPWQLGEHEDHGPIFITDKHGLKIAKVLTQCPDHEVEPNAEVIAKAATTSEVCSDAIRALQNILDHCHYAQRKCGLGPIAPRQHHIWAAKAAVTRYEKLNDPSLL